MENKVVRRGFLLFLTLAYFSAPNVSVGQESDGSAEFSRAEAFYLNGKYYEAFPLLLQAAELGHVEAQARVGWMYEKGKGVERSQELAVSWYEPAADSGDSHAQHALGEMLLAGRGVERDEVLGASWVQLAAAQGNINALHRLGTLYRLGIGVDKDEIKSRELYRQAFKRGYTPPRSALSRSFLFQQQELSRGAR